MQQGIQLYIYIYIYIYNNKNYRCQCYVNLFLKVNVLLERHGVLVLVLFDDHLELFTYGYHLASGERVTITSSCSLSCLRRVLSNLKIMVLDPKCYHSVVIFDLKCMSDNTDM